MTRTEIAEAVACKKWQTFRKDMKGKPTTEKLILLRMWIAAAFLCGDTCCKESVRNVQVQNYLNALARGGQVGPCSTLTKLLGNAIEVRR